MALAAREKPAAASTAARIMPGSVQAWPKISPTKTKPFFIHWCARISSTRSAKEPRQVALRASAGLASMPCFLPPRERKHGEQAKGEFRRRAVPRSRGVDGLRGDEHV